MCTIFLQKFQTFFYLQTGLTWKLNGGEYYTIEVVLTFKRLHVPTLKKHASANECVTQQSYGNPASLTFSYNWFST